MNTGLLSWRRVLILAQTLCLVAVAAIFLVSPFVALAGCGPKGGNNKNNNVKVVKGITVVGTIRQVDKNAPANAFNGGLPIPGIPAGSITINKNFTLKDLTPGTWITGLRSNGELFQGTIFNVSKVNGGQNVAEVWITPDSLNPLNPQPGQGSLNPLNPKGQIIKNVLLPPSIPAA